MPDQRHQAELFSAIPEKFALQDANISYWPSFISTDKAAALFDDLLRNTDWRQETIRLFGKEHLTPRLSSWVADAGLDYTYSNLTMQPVAWNGTLNMVKTMVEEAAGTDFNSVLLNYYRDGRDSNGWHADNEPELGFNPVIASLSLGAPRDFQLRHSKLKHLKHSISLQHGSLLIMAGNTQACWKHQVPKRPQAGPRINLTFRKIKTPSRSDKK